MSKEDFAFELLKRYASVNGSTLRSTSDLSPLEEWLISLLFVSDFHKKIKDINVEKEELMEKIYSFVTFYAE